MTTFVTWSPAERIKGVTTLRLFDMDNRSLGETKPANILLLARDLMMNPLADERPDARRVSRRRDARRRHRLAGLLPRQGLTGPDPRPTLSNSTSKTKFEFGGIDELPVPP